MVDAALDSGVREQRARGRLGTSGRGRTAKMKSRGRGNKDAVQGICLECCFVSGWNCGHGEELAPRRIFGWWCWWREANIFFCSVAGGGEASRADSLLAVESSELIGPRPGGTESDHKPGPPPAAALLGEGKFDLPVASG